MDTTFPALQTPCFIVQEEKVDSLLAELQHALNAHWPNHLIGYSFKTNNLPWMIRHMQKKGCLAEVVSDDEYALARALAYSPADIIFNGPVKSKSLVLASLKAGTTVNLDAQREVRWVLQNHADLGHYTLGLRANFDIEGLCPGESTGGDKGGRFGFCVENGEFRRVFEELVQHRVKVSGLHLHISSKTRSLNIYKAIARMAVQLSKDCGWTPSYIDVGGGFFGGVEGKPSFDDYLREMAAILKEQFSPDTTRLIVEPGMSLVGASIDYLTSVTDVKQTTYGTFVTTDGSRTHIDPLMTKTGYEHLRLTPEGSAQKPVEAKQVICGFTCIEGDRLMTIEGKSRLQEGERILYKRVGAYSICLSPQFIQFSPAVYVQRKGDLRLVRRRFTAEQALINSLLEDE